MSFVLRDRVKTTTTTTGTGTLTISTTAPIGYQNATAIADGVSSTWLQIDPATGDWQTFVGTVAGSGTTVTKDVILDGSSGLGVAVSFAAGTKDVWCDLPASMLGYQQIGTTQTPSGVASSSITGIPDCYSDLLVEILGLSHDSGSYRALRIELSGDNGSNWTAATNVTGSGIAGSAVLYGHSTLLGYRRATGNVFTSTANLTADIKSGTGVQVQAVWRIAAGINAIRFSWSGGALIDAGSYNLWGKL